MKRSGFIKRSTGQSKDKHRQSVSGKNSPLAGRSKRRKPVSPLKVGSVGRSAVRKGPARDAGHLAEVRRFGCWLCHKMPAEAHHVRCIAPRSMGKRVSDYLTVPLCKFHHSAIHEGCEQVMWALVDLDPRDFIRSFSKEGAAEIAKLNGTAAKPSDGDGETGR